MEDFTEWWQEAFLYVDHVGVALAKAVKLGVRGKKLRALIAEKMLVEATSEMGGNRIFMALEAREGEVVDRGFEEDVFEAIERKRVAGEWVEESYSDEEAE